MNTTTTIEPIRMSTTVPLTPEDAFELFTTKVATWWPLEKFAVFPGNTESCIFETHVGGRVIERSRSGEEGVWAEILVYDRPHRVVLAWHPGTDRVTEVIVTFTPADDGTYVELEHRGWEIYEDPEKARANYANGWPVVFGTRFVAAATAR